MLRRSIYVDPSAVPSAKKHFRTGKRVCAALAAIAIAIGTLDLMDVRLASAVAGFTHDIHQRIADLPDKVRSEINSISLLLPSRTVTVTIATKEESSAAVRQPAPLQLGTVNLNTLPAIGTRSASDLQLRFPSPAERLHLTAASLAKAKRCLSKAIYFEARAEPVRGQNAVAQVIMNRVFSGFYPNDICDVVYQNADRHLECQFTFACDGKSKIVNERGAWARASRIASQTLAGNLYDPIVGYSTHYHAIYVRPDWVNEMRKVVRFGTHHFYRPIVWGNGAEEPVWGAAATAQNTKKAK